MVGSSSSRAVAVVARAVAFLAITAGLAITDSVPVLGKTTTSGVFPLGSPPSSAPNYDYPMSQNLSWAHSGEVHFCSGSHGWFTAEATLNVTSRSNGSVVYSQLGIDRGGGFPAEAQTTYTFSLNGASAVVDVLWNETYLAESPSPGW
jgi:hypothetical protein